MYLKEILALEPGEMIYGLELTEHYSIYLSQEKNIMNPLWVKNGIPKSFSYYSPSIIRNFVSVKKNNTISHTTLYRNEKSYRELQNHEIFLFKEFNEQEPFCMSLGETIPFFWNDRPANGSFICFHKILKDNHIIWVELVSYLDLDTKTIPFDKKMELI